MFGLFKEKPQPINDEILKIHLITSLREKLESMNNTDRTPYSNISLCLQHDYRLCSTSSGSCRIS